MRTRAGILLALFLSAGVFPAGAARNERPAAPDGLEQGFARPPASARPWVYWFWLNGNISREGITADLQAMRRAGIGGVLIMEVDQGAPPGPVPFASARWRALFRHAVSESRRLGLQVNMNDDAGWNGSGGPWITPDKAMQKLVWTETPVTGGRRVQVTLPQPPATAGYYRDVALLAFPTPGEYRIPDIAGKSALVRQDQWLQSNFPPAPDGASIPRDRILDLTSQMSPEGRLTWDAPAGSWTLLRLGHTPTGATNAPAPESGRGLECDKLSPEGSEAAFDGLMGKLIADAGPLAGPTLVSTHIDSWENGSQNWTPRFREQFQRLRHYDPLPYLPAMTGRVVESREVSERFLGDLRQTISDLLIENYAGHMRALANRHSLRLSIEAYGDTTVDDMAYAGRADEPMAEFWSWSPYGAAGTLIEMTSAAHVYGKPIIGAEAFTADSNERWLSHPATIKALGDWAFTQGINRFVVHRYALQPWTDRRPGMSMGPWGLHYERTQTWWELSKPWHEYLARCQYLLRQGRFVADVLYLQPEGAPRTFAPPPPVSGAAAARPGYNYDGCTPEALLTRVTVRNGRLMLPDGMSYRVLVLPNVDTLTPRLLRRVRELVDAGATVIGPRPRKSPSLEDYPGCDAAVQALADSLWGSGKVIDGKAAEQVLAGMGIPHDFQADRVLNYIHRHAGDTDLYLVANGRQQAVNALCQFRVTGKRVQLWHPDTGRIEPAAIYEDTGRVTRVPLRLRGSDSVFVLFRPGRVPRDPVANFGLVAGPSTTRSGRTEVAKIVVLRALWGPAGDAARTKDVTEQVQRLIDASDGSFLVADLAAWGDPAPNVVKTLRVDYEINGRRLTATGTDPQVIALQLPPDPEQGARLERLADGSLVAEVSRPGVYEARTRSGRVARLRVPSVPPAISVEGPWEVRFDPPWVGPESARFEKLISWSEHPDPRIRFYSGAAAYRTTVVVPPTALGHERRAYLDLGDVEVIASVRLNGKALGILWKPPFRVDVTGALRPGRNTLEIRVVNLWVNRLIGDEELPEDSARNRDGTLTDWPAWLQAGRPSPTGRFTFTSWRLWKKEDRLQPSGLLGPVQVLTVRQVRLPETTVRE